MNLEEIKLKFKHKQIADIKDLDYILRAGPYLVKEVERLEKELEQAEKRIEHLLAQTQKRFPMERKGKQGEASWNTWVDEKNNRLFIKVSGKIDYNSAKSATNNILLILPNLRKNFDIITDISEISADSDSKAVFHLRKIHYSLKMKGIGKAIRIINPKLDNINSHFDSLSNEAGYKVYFANSIEEAVNMLENVNRYLKV